MNCPKCKIEMGVTKQDTSNNPQNRKIYDRTVFVCKDCDVWVSVEIPKIS